MSVDLDCEQKEALNKLLDGATYDEMRDMIQYIEDTIEAGQANDIADRTAPEYNTQWRY